MWDYRARVDRVIDGDTVVAYLDKGTYDYSLMDVRLADVWCPERGQPGYAECKAFTQAWVDGHTGEWPLIVTTERIKSGEHEERSFARYVATITANPDASDSLNAAIEQFRVANGYGPGEETPKTHPARHGKARQ